MAKKLTLTTQVALKEEEWYFLVTNKIKRRTLSQEIRKSSVNTLTFWKNTELIVRHLWSNIFNILEQVDTIEIIDYEWVNEREYLKDIYYTSERFKKTLTWGYTWHSWHPNILEFWKRWNEAWKKNRDLYLFSIFTDLEEAIYECDWWYWMLPVIKNILDGKKIYTRTWKILDPKSISVFIERLIQINGMNSDEKEQVLHWLIIPDRISDLILHLQEIWYFNKSVKIKPDEEL